MKKFAVSLLCAFVPVRSVRHQLRARLLGVVDDYGKNNRAELVKPDGSIVKLRYLPNVHIVFKGNNNLVRLHEPVGDLKLEINVNSNVEIELMPSRGRRRFYIQKSDAPNEHNRLLVGQHCSTTDVLHIDFSSGASNVTIGNDVMFSWGIAIRPGDCHTIYSLADNSKILNQNQDISVGDHVWIGADVLLLKGAKISNNTVVGTRAVVNKAFDEENVILAGMPANIVKRNINWDRRSTGDYKKFVQQTDLSGSL